MLPMQRIFLGGGYPHGPLMYRHSSFSESQVINAALEAMCKQIYKHIGNPSPAMWFELFLFFNRNCTGQTV